MVENELLWLKYRTRAILTRETAKNYRIDISNQLNYHKSIMANLTSAALQFFTPDSTNDKDFDTAISADIRCFDGTLCASASNIANNPDRSDYFPDNGTWSAKTYPLAINNAVDKDAVVHGYTEILITPVGNDTWVFYPRIILGFSDGSRLDYQVFPPHTVDCFKVPPAQIH